MGLGAAWNLLGVCPCSCLQCNRKFTRPRRQIAGPGVDRRDGAAAGQSDMVLGVAKGNGGGKDGPVSRLLRRWLNRLTFRQRLLLGAVEFGLGAAGLISFAVAGSPLPLVLGIACLLQSYVELSSAIFLRRRGRLDGTQR
jgi:hypothetical protein